LSRLKRLIRHPVVIALLLGIAIVASFCAFVAVPTPNPEISPGITERQPDIAHGQYVAVLGDCAACHTAPKGEKLAGGVPFPTPVGTVYSSNITPDRETGIGAYSFKDFVRLMRLGVKPDGTRLYPAMPYTAYAKVSDEDLLDLFAYLQQEVVPVRQATRTDGTAWPLSMRWPLAIWNLAFLDKHGFTPDPSQSADWNRGAYLVQGLEHCGTCHTPRGFALQEKDVSGGSNLFLAGSVLDSGSPINLRGNDGDGLARWSADDIVQILTTGRNAHSAVTGSMTEVVAESTQYLTPGDAAAIATYLKSLSPASEKGRATFTPGDEATLRTITSGAEQSPGGRIFMDSCAACHRLSAGGESQVFPGLTGNPSVLSQDPSSLIAVILNGNRLPSTAGAPSDLAMPGFAWRYDDKAIAELASFIRSSWGNHASAVTPTEVAALRN
jgi:mono/diheme cytochrome c family protein